MAKGIIYIMTTVVPGLSRSATSAVVDFPNRNVSMKKNKDSMFDRMDAYRKAICEHVYSNYPY